MMRGTVYSDVEGKCVMMRGTVYSDVEEKLYNHFIPVNIYNQLHE